MGILPLKKCVNRDKCSFATKQRMFGVFAIDEILRYRGTRFPGSRTLCHPGAKSRKNGCKCAESRLHTFSHSASWSITGTPTSLLWLLSITLHIPDFCLIDIDIGIDWHQHWQRHWQQHWQQYTHLGFEDFLFWRIFGRGRAATDWFRPFTWLWKNLIELKLGLLLSFFVPNCCFFLWISQKPLWLPAFAPEPAFLALVVDGRT